MSNYLKFLANFGIGGAHPGGLPLTKELLGNEDIDRRTKVLDAGCGTGQTAAYLVKEFQCDVVALDYDEVMLEKVKQRFAQLGLNGSIVQGTTENLPFSDAIFDIVLAESVISFTNASKSLRNFARVLRKEGYLLAIEMTKTGELTEDERNRVKEFYGVKDILSEDEWCNEMLLAGFSEVETMTATFTHENATLEEISEFAFSCELDVKMFQIWIQHQEMVEQLRDRLTYRVYRAKK